jgi:hypothetical protein
VDAPFEFAHRIGFSPENAEALLLSVPATPGIFALRGDDPASEPYLTHAADLRRRLRRLLAPPEADANGQPVLSRRLNLRNRVRFIDYTLTGSGFESTLLLYRASRAAFGAEAARKRLRLYPPYFLRITLSHPHPRVYSTNRLSKRSLAETFGPFPSRAAAERYCDAVLDLFQLRRCYEDLAPHPEHPGCVYGEMNKCMRPCQQACTPAQYAQEANRVHAFFTTRGQSLLEEVAAQREAASEAMDFELAATLHKHWEKVRAASLLADDLVRPVEALRAVILQEAAPASGYPEPPASGYIEPPASGCPEALASGLMGSENQGALAPGVKSQDAAVFLLEHGILAGPARLSTLGVRAVREQTAVGSSLFAQPLMLAPVPLEPPQNSVILSEGAGLHPAPQNNAVILSGGPELAEGPESKNPGAARPTTTARTISTTNLTPEDRARAVLNHLATQTETTPERNFDIADLCDTLSLLRRWYYRPEKQRQGELFLPNPDHSWPIRRILNGAARVVLGPPTAAAPVDREAAKALKTKIIHAGREGVEREVPVLPKRARTRKTITPGNNTV